MIIKINRKKIKKLLTCIWILIVIINKNKHKTNIKIYLLIINAINPIYRKCICGFK